MAHINMIKISFILPCYNVGRYVGDCLDSIFAQDMPDHEFEVICVNDCSTDNTRDVIASYADNHPNLTLIDHQENLTAGGARNTGITVAKGKYIWFVDPDDVIKPQCLCSLYAQAEEKNAEILFFNFDDADEQLHVLREDRTYSDTDVCPGQEYVTKYFPGQLSVFGIIWRELYSTRFLRESGVRYPLMRKAQDVVFLWNALLEARRVCSVHQAYYTYRSNPYSVTKHPTLAKVAFSERVLLGAETVKMMNGKEILPILGQDMEKTIRWCSCSNHELLARMDQEERGRYYNEMCIHKDAIEILRPYMNRKSRVLFHFPVGKKCWLMKVRFLCGKPVA